MAERLGFEPRKELPLCRFSRPVLSTAQPSLREQGFISIILKFNKKTELFFLKNLICLKFVSSYPTKSYNLVSLSLTLLFVIVNYVLVNIDFIF